MKKRNKKTLTIIIPILIVIILSAILLTGYHFIIKTEQKKFLDNIDTSYYAKIDNYAIYGIHMNIEGTVDLENKETINLVLANDKKEYPITWEYSENTFQTSEYINDGLNLETIEEGTYYLLIKTTEYNENEELITKYYSVENNSKYSDLEYYTLTKNNQNYKIDIEWNTYEQFPTLRFKVEKTNLPEDTYDITIDPGHDSRDPGKTICLNNNTIYDPNYYGECYNGGYLYKESDINLQIATILKQKLETKGYKVTMTRETKEDEVEIYDPMGSATMANDTNSKLNIAIHNNSSGIDGGLSELRGTEIYIANDTTLDFATNLLNKLEASNLPASSKEQYKLTNGIYQRFFTEQEIANDDVQPSNKTTETIYYYYIREVGGVSTHATNDGRYAPTYPKNEHYNSNNTAESYLIELAYMDNLEDINILTNNQESIATALANAIDEYLK